MAVLGSPRMMRGLWNASKEALSRIPAPALLRLGWIYVYVAGGVGGGEGERGRGKVPVTGKGWHPQIPLPNRHCFPVGPADDRGLSPALHMAPRLPTTRTRIILPPGCIHVCSHLCREEAKHLIPRERRPGAHEMRLILRLAV